MSIKELLVIGCVILFYIVLVILCVWLLSVGSISKVDRCMNNKLVYDINRAYYICNELYKKNY